MLNKTGKILGNERGLGLLEYIGLSTAVLALLAVSYRVAVNSQLAKKRAKQITGYTQLTNYLSKVASDQGSCAIGLKLTSGELKFSSAALASNSPTLPVAIYLPDGSTFDSSTNNIIGLVKITQLNLVLTKSITSPIPFQNSAGGKDNIYTGTLNIAGTKLVAGSLVPVPALSFPLSVAIAGSNDAVIGCSSYRDQSENLITSPPCSIYQAATISPDGGSVTCKTVLCPNNSIPNGYDAMGNVKCDKIPPDRQPGTCLGPGMGYIHVNDIAGAGAPSGPISKSGSEITSYLPGAWSTGCKSIELNSNILGADCPLPASSSTGPWHYSSIDISTCDHPTMQDGIFIDPVQGLSCILKRPTPEPGYACEQIVCPDAVNAPFVGSNDPVKFPSLDPNGYPLSCHSFNDFCIGCVTAGAPLCNPIMNPKLEIGGYKGYYCPTDLPINKGRMCVEDCSVISPESSSSCPLVALTGASQHTSAQCLADGGMLVQDPLHPDTHGRVVCMMPPTNKPYPNNNPFTKNPNDQDCWNGWTLYGKKYTPNISACPNPIPISLNWNGVQDYRPYYAGQWDSFPLQFRGADANSSDDENSCKNWLKKQPDKDMDPDQKKDKVLMYSKAGDGKVVNPVQPIIQAGFRTPDLIFDSSSFACVKSMSCKICQGDMTDAQRFFFNAFIMGAATVLTGGSFAVIAIATSVAGGLAITNKDTGGIFHISPTNGNNETACNRPATTDFAGGHQLLCYVSGPSNCKMVPDLEMQGVFYDVKTYCY